MLAHVDSQPPLTIRRVRADAPDVCALCLVGTAAGPLDGDDLSLSIDVADGAAATLVAAGASIAQGGSSSYRTSVRVDGSLRARPGALIVSAGAHVDVSLDIALGPDAELDWQEIVVLGRTGEPPGSAALRWDVTRAGRPVLRQQVDLRPTGWRGATDGHRVLVTALRTGAHIDARTVVHSPTAVSARLDEHTVLSTVLAPDTATAEHEMAALISNYARMD